MKYKKFLITVKRKGKKEQQIKRVIYGKITGQGCRYYCKYNKKEYLVKSEVGILTDTFIYDNKFLNTLYIEKEEPHENFSKQNTLSI